jgi:hypothetical protein
MTRTQIHKPKPGELRDAVIHNDVQAVAALLEQGAGLDDADEKGRTALWFSVSRNPEIAALLVEHGADPHKKAGNGQNAFDLLEDHYNMFWGYPPASEEKVRKIFETAAARRERFLEQQQRLQKEARRLEETRQREAAAARQKRLKDRATKINIKP